MNKKTKVKRKKFNLFKTLIFLLTLYLIGYGGLFVTKQPIKNIRVFDNYLLDDQFILEQAKIDNYPSFLFTTNKKIKQRLLKNKLIKDVKIKRSFTFRLDLYIKEYKLLFYNQDNDTLVLENKQEINCQKVDISLPILINYVPDTIYDDFINSMLVVKNDISSKISEILYQPNEVDKERFFLTMTDGNYVYLTLARFKQINEYNNILVTLENKRGILYLDAGNYFEILE